jgi:hypothetical protein
MPYVIQNVETGKYVSPLGSARSYTSKLKNARRFDTKEQAIQSGVCLNERIIPIGEFINV